MTTKSQDIMILDAPGINGAGGKCASRFAAYVEAGGPILHPVNPDLEHLAKVRRGEDATSLAAENAAVAAPEVC